jgi:N-acetyl-anhydromuramyl-L-alanine amidase AmpD
MTIEYRDFPKEEYIAKPQKKDLIVLHHTVSSTIDSAIRHWRADKGASKVATAYVVGKDGTIAELFDPAFWAIHLYRHKKNEPAHLYADERRSIGIELVNEGPLTQRMIGSKNRYFWNDGRLKFDGEGARISFDYRGLGFLWAMYTDEQYEALKFLIGRLSERFEIPNRFEESTEVFPSASPSAPLGDQNRFKGICSHRNFVKYKTDVSPVFDWERIKN